MHDWLIEEELDVEAIIESIASLNFLGETKEKMIQKKNTIVNNLNDLNTGKKTIIPNITSSGLQREVIS